MFPAVRRRLLVLFPFLRLSHSLYSHTPNSPILCFSSSPSRSYIFGSSQLLPSTGITPESILPPPSPRHALPGSSAATIEATSTYVPPLRKIDLDAPEPPPTRRAQAPGAGAGTGEEADDFYSMAIRRIGRIKSGNWYEHSVSPFSCFHLCDPVRIVSRRRFLR